MDIASLSPDARRELLDKYAIEARSRIDRIRDTDEYRDAVRDIILRNLHEKQRMVWNHLINGTRYLSLCCSRRAGKTHFLASLIILLMLRAKFGQEVVFVAPTLKRGKELIWRELDRFIDEFYLDWDRREHIGTVTTKAGALFRIVGLDNKRQIGKVSRGGNMLAMLCDEAQETYQLLAQLLVGAGPGLAQSKGAFIASGTPGPVPHGYWHAIATQGEAGFTAIHWTLLDNPHLGRPAEDILLEERVRNKWDENHPDYVREYLGRWTVDTRSLVVEFSKELNVVDEIPGYSKRTWRHWMGQDFGFNDPSSWVVLTAAPHSRDVYVIHASKQAGLTDDELASRSAEVFDTFCPKMMVGDSASGGKVFMESWNRRYGKHFGVHVRSARKADKRGSISTLNTELRTGRLKVLRSGASLVAQFGDGNDRMSPAEVVRRREILAAGAAELIDELMSLQRAPEDESDPVKPGQDDHCFDALRYAFNDCNAFLSKLPPPQPTAEELELERIKERNRAARQAMSGDMLG
jgi:hypothetical protein